jgi:hypothetical protein
MIELKTGVRILGLRPEMLLAVQVAESLWQAEGVTLVVTSAMDGVHSANSGHYRGCAVDFRTNTLAPGRVAAVVRALAAALGPDFFVLYEAEGTPNAHCHAEYRPQGAY